MESTKTELELLKDLKFEEGFRSEPYRDSLSNFTIGYGRLMKRGFTLAEHTFLFPDLDHYPINLQDSINYFRRNPMTKEEATFLLKNDIKTTEEDAKIIYKDKWDLLPGEVKVGILDMLFNLGQVKYKKFKKHIAAIKDGNYEEGALQVEQSLAAKQAPRRYKAIADRIRSKG